MVRKQRECNTSLLGQYNLIVSVQSKRSRFCHKSLCFVLYSKICVSILAIIVFVWQQLFAQLRRKTFSLSRCQLGQCTPRRRKVDTRRVNTLSTSACNSKSRSVLGVSFPSILPYVTDVNFGRMMPNDSRFQRTRLVHLSYLKQMAASETPIRSILTIITWIWLCTV